MSKSFLDAFSAATQEDLDDVREQIEAKQKELDGLMIAEKLLDTKINGKKQRAKPGPRISNPQESALGLQDRRLKVARFIMANGAKSKTKLSESTGIAMQGPGCMSQVLNCPWFHVAPDGMATLTGEGERHGNRAV